MRQFSLNMISKHGIRHCHLCLIENEYFVPNIFETNCQHSYTNHHKHSQKLSCKHVYKTMSHFQR